MKKIIIGSRRSQLAKTQATLVIEDLKQNFPEYEFIHKIIGSEGDRDRTTKLSEMGGVGAFTREIQECLLEEKIDIAVHSLKDLPTQSPPGLIFAATLKREDARDALCGSTLENLPQGAKIGTGSLRRTAQILRIRPDLNIVAIRGNLPPRLAKITGPSPLNAVILACAGINRLDLSDRITQYLDIYDFLPPAGQGALGLEVRNSDSLTLKVLSQINDTNSYTCVSAERQLLHKLHGGCSVPIGTYCEFINSEHLKFTASITSKDGKERAFSQRVFPLKELNTQIEEIYSDLLSQGGIKILEKSAPHI